MYDSAWGKVLLVRLLSHKNQLNFISPEGVRGNVSHAKNSQSSRNAIVSLYAIRCAAARDLLREFLLVFAILFDLSATKMSNSKLNVFE